MLLVKLSGIILIVVSSAMVGFLKSRSLILRSKKFSELLEGVNMLYEYIEQEGCELAKAVENSFVKSRIVSFENNKILFCTNDLRDYELAEIEDFFSKLGSSTKKIECDRIVNFKLKIKQLYDAAENEASQKCKIYQMFGVCIGLTIGILLV